MTDPSADEPLPDETTPVKPSKMRGLWSVMNAPDAPTDDAPAVDPGVESAATESDDARPAPRGLWSMMRDRAPITPADDVPQPEEELEPFELVDEGDEPAAEEEPAEAAIAVAAEAPAEDALGEEFVFEPDHVDTRKSRGWQAMLLGIAALPLSAMAWFGALWVSIITAVCGFGALVIAAAEWTATGPIDRGERWKVTVGAIAGALALVLGPYVFSPLGNADRDRRSGRNTRLHLQQIGVAIGQYRQASASFPIGGTILRDHEGRSRGGHSWMAAVLPHLGEQRLFDQIDFSQAYDAPVNFPAMSQPVTGFFAAGGDRSPNGGGYAISHFAGVGGEVQSPRGEVQPAGVFRAGKPLTADDVTDGLATTLMAGELGGRYPAWGDPENFRVPGAGLNKDNRGFGNAARTGAWLLFADGHVRFFSNNTDAEVLRRLSTRNAGDLTAGIE